jgi:hypothetical protein
VPGLPAPAWTAMMPGKAQPNRALHERAKQRRDPEIPPSAGSLQAMFAGGFARGGIERKAFVGGLS